MDRLPETGMTQQESEGGMWSERGGDPCTADRWQRRGLLSTPQPQVDHARLARTLETEVIPRLVLAHQSPGSPGISRRPLLPVAAGADPMEVEAFVRILLTRDLSVASARVDALRMRGVPLDELCTRLLTPAARLLGEMWVEDLCEFTDVTLGLWRLQHVLREFSEAARDEHRPAQRGLRILLVPAPGEQHSFGITMVGEVFRLAGWDVCGGVPATARDLGELARSEWFDIVGISLASDRFVDSVRTSIATVRRTSRNRGVGILAGGKAFAEDAGLGDDVGADTVVLDGHHAPLEAERTLSAIARVRR